MIVIYGSVLSPFVRKVLITLELKQISYRNQELNPFVDTQRHHLLKMNPLGKIPVYQEYDFTISDSSVICAYLEKKSPQNPLYPHNAESYAKSLWHEEYADSLLTPTVGILFFNTIIAPLLGQKSNTESINGAHEKLPIIFEYFNDKLSNKNYLIDNKFSIADIATITAFTNLELAGFYVDDTQWPNLAAYITRIRANNSVAKISTLALEKCKEIARS